MENFPKHTETKESEDLITPERRQQVMHNLQIYIQSVQSRGANDVEVEAQNLFRELHAGAPVTKKYVNAILGQLGNPDDKNTNYH